MANQTITAASQESFTVVIPTTNARVAVVSGATDVFKVTPDAKVTLTGELTASTGTVVLESDVSSGVSHRFEPAGAVPAVTVSADAPIVLTGAKLSVVQSAPTGGTDGDMLIWQDGNNFHLCLRVGQTWYKSPAATTI